MIAQLISLFGLVCVSIGLGGLIVWHIADERFRRKDDYIDFVHDKLKTAEEITPFI